MLSFLLKFVFVALNHLPNGGQITLSNLKKKCPKNVIVLKLQKMVFKF